MSIRHRVAITVDGHQLEDFTSYSIRTSMFRVDDFSISMPMSLERWRLCDRDAAIAVYIDDTQKLDGFIDERQKRGAAEGSRLEISGRSKEGRLRDESQELAVFDGLTLLELAERVAGEWYPSVVLSNARNRNLIRGRGRKVPGGAEPIVENDEMAPRKVDPGDTRWQVLEQFLREAALLAWASADGREFIVGRPNYDQPRQFRFFDAAEGSARRGEVNVTELGVTDSVAELYSEITVCGSGLGSAANYGANVTNRRGIARDGDGDRGVGRRFRRPKRLTLSQDDLTSVRMAEERAREAMAVRAAQGHLVSVTAPYHGQVVSGSEPTLFGFDLLAHVEDEETGTEGEYLIVEADYEGDRNRETTSMRLVERGAELRVGGV